MINHAGFKVGDRVKSLVTDFGTGIAEGDYGTVTGINALVVFVEFGNSTTPLIMLNHEIELVVLTATRAIFGDANSATNSIDWDLIGSLPIGFHRPDFSGKNGEIGVIRPYGEEDRASVWKLEGRCPQCGELGRYINLGATCSIHGGY